MKTLSNETLIQVSKFLKALSEPTRLKILRSFHDEELTVTDIISKISAGQSNVSKHLAILTTVGIVTARKEGTSTFYKIADPNITAILDTVCRSIAERIRQSQSTLRNIQKVF